MKRSIALIIVGCLIAGLLSVPAGALAVPNASFEPVTFTQKATATLNTAIPSTYMSELYPKGQGNDKVAWAFAAVAVLEEASRQAFGSSENYSANHMRYALSNDSGNNLGFSRGYTASGNRHMVTAYLMRSTLGGPVFSAVDPYTSGTNNDGTITSPRPAANTKNNVQAARATGVVYIPDLSANPTDEEKSLYLGRIKENVFEQGAVACTLFFDEGFVKNGVFRYTGNHSSDHSVAIIGYNDAYQYTYTSYGDVEHYGNGAFLVVDSAYNNGQGGTYYVTYDSVIRDAYTVNGLARKLFDKTYEYDPYGLTNLIGVSGNTGYFSTVFTVQSEAEALAAVSFFAASENTEYSIYGAPVTTSVEDALDTAVQGNALRMSGGATSGVAELPGYYTVNFQKDEGIGAKNSQYVLVVKVTTPYSTTPIPLQSYSYGGSGRSGDCYISGDGAEWTDAYTNNIASVCLKAHVKTGVTIPAQKVILPTTDGASMKVGSKNYSVFVAALGHSYSMLPTFEPMNSNDIRTIEWYTGAIDSNVLTLAAVKNIVSSVATPTSSTSPSPSPSPSTAQSTATNAFVGNTGTFHANVLEDIHIRCLIIKKDGTSISDDIVISIREKDITDITLQATDITVKSNAPFGIKATVNPADTNQKLKWHVAADAEMNPFLLDYDSSDRFQQGRPILSVDEQGIFTPIMPGVCYVYASNEDGSIKSGVCKVTVDETPLTGVSLAKKKLKMVSGSSFTVPVVTKPRDATFNSFTWVSSDEAVAYVDNNGTITAVSAGEVTITATSYKGDFTASCVVTVNEGLNAVVKDGGSASFGMYGVRNGETVKWSFVGVGTDSSLYSDVFTTVIKGNKIKLSGIQPGKETLRAVIEEDYLDMNGETVSRVVREQTFVVACVIPLSKIGVKNELGENIKKLTLCYDPQDASRVYTVAVHAEAVKPEDATLLEFAWSSKNPEVAEAVQLPDGSAMIVPKGIGTAKIMVVNYNGNKKAYITVKVVLFPDSITLNKSEDITVRLGKSTTIKGTVNSGKNLKTVSYVISDSGTNETPHTAENPVAEISATGKIKTIRTGRVLITAVAAPYGEYAPNASVYVDVVVPVKSIELSEKKLLLLTGDKYALDVTYNPEDTTIRDFTVVSQKPEIVEAVIKDGRILITCLSAGVSKITVECGGKRTACTITVRNQ